MQGPSQFLISRFSQQLHFRQGPFPSAAVASPATPPAPLPWSFGARWRAVRVPQQPLQFLLRVSAWVDGYGHGSRLMVAHIRFWLLVIGYQSFAGGVASRQAGSRRHARYILDMDAAHLALDDFRKNGMEWDHLVTAIDSMGDFNHEWTRMNTNSCRNKETEVKVAGVAEHAMPLLAQPLLGHGAEQRIFLLRPGKLPCGTRLIRRSPLDPRFRLWSFHVIGYRSSFNRRLRCRHEQAEAEVSAVTEHQWPTHRFGKRDLKCRPRPMRPSTVAVLPFRLKFQWTQAPGIQRDFAQSFKLFRRG